MRTLLVIPLDRADEVPIVRYAVQAAHARRGAWLLLDLRRVPELGDQSDDLLEEFRATAEGNGQHFAVLGAAEGHEGEVRGFQDLAEAMRGLAPEAKLPYEVELVLPSRIDDLPAVRTFLAETASGLHPGAGDFHLAMLLDEICQNAIQNSPSNKSHYEVLFRTDAEQVRLEVTNQAAESFPPERIMQRRLDSFDDSGDYLGDRGRGLFLIARLADEMDIRAAGEERITVSVTKRVPAAD
jgi:anti-sigma regulatory factor (Ser/Thr protein kinase)